MEAIHKTVPVDKAFAQPITLNIGDQKYKFRRIMPSDFAALAGAMRDTRINAIMRHRGQLRDPAIFSRTVARVCAAEPSDDERWDYFNTPEGQGLLVWRCLSHYQPTMSREQFDVLIEENGGLHYLLLLGAMLAFESGVTDMEQEGGGDGSDPTTAEPPTTSSEMPQCFATSDTSETSETPPTSNGPSGPVCFDSPPND